MVNLTLEEVKKRFNYDPETGFLFRNGKKVGTDNGKGYLYVSIRSKKYYVHRLIWFYMMGKWPIEIDHINGVRSDNTWSNLRECTRRGNLQNLKVATNPSKLMGVSFCKRFNCYKSQVGINGKSKWLGYFKTPEEAHAAYMKAKEFYHLENKNGT